VAEHEFLEFLKRIGPIPYYTLRVARSPLFPEKTDELPWCLDVPRHGLALRNVVMSWWLSPVVQHFLDEQMCSVDNEIVGKVRRYGSLPVASRT
jgi:hypothetical protein